MVGCSHWTQSYEGINFCTSFDDIVSIERWCDQSASSQVGTVLVGVEPEEFEGDCDGYGLKVLATYGPGLPF